MLQLILHRDHSTNLPTIHPEISLDGDNDRRSIGFATHVWDIDGGEDSEQPQTVDVSAVLESTALVRPYSSHE